MEENVRMLQDEVRKTPARYLDILEPSCHFLTFLSRFLLVSFRVE